MSPLGKNDHSVLQFRCTTCVSNAYNVTKLNYNKGSYNELRDHLPVILLYVICRIIVFP